VTRQGEGGSLPALWTNLPGRFKFEKRVGEAIVDPVLSKQNDDLEPTLTRHGRTAKVLAELLDIGPARSGHC
jgi:hypothetical protein